MIKTNKTYMKKNVYLPLSIMIVLFWTAQDQPAAPNI